MSYRQHKSNRQAELRAWNDWLARNAAPLKSAGLPPDVLLSRDHWIDFLQNGSLDLHPESDAGFSFRQLSDGQMRQLLSILEQSPEFADEPMAGWIRYRLKIPK